MVSPIIERVEKRKIGNNKEKYKLLHPSQPKSGVAKLIIHRRSSGSGNQLGLFLPNFFGLLWLVHVLFLSVVVIWDLNCLPFSLLSLDFSSSFISACLSKNLSSKRLFRYDYDRGFYLCKYVF